MNINPIFKYIIFFQTIIYTQSYTLNDCIHIAIEGKKTVLSSELDVLSSYKGLISSYSSFLPSVQVSSGIGRTYFPELENYNIDFEKLTIDTTRSNFYSNYNAGIYLNQKIYDGGRSLNQIKKAKIALEISKYNQRLKKIEVIQNVIRSYYGLLQAEKLLDVSEKNLEMSIQQVAFVKKQFDLGVVKKTDLLKAEVAQGQAKVDMLSKKSNFQNARRILFNDMGLQDFGQEITTAENEWAVPIIPSSSDILNKLKEWNPSLLISKAQTRLNEFTYKDIKGLRLPSLNTSVNYSANSETGLELIDSFKDNWSLGMNLSISLPIYSGNALSIQQQQAKLLKQKSDYTYITLLNNLRVQAELIRETLTNYAEIIPLNQSVVKSAKEDLKLAKERYGLGSATILEILDAQISLISSNSNLINAVHDARIQEANLKALLGILDTEYKIKEE